ncbi:SGNH/GDSL hydrolase family protein [Nordella sp. HKS 07]|uniref:SGNH/GDSL hydrolase family protein n=1 Tax=Nordella sp. HKS 07 TaxID=2712222 RepID=UPI0013E1F53D|nr:SGNH/GDSL hydrolase family protein [Nordella sp. HKS 07]QIG48302.1 SGNH/GDSL hydrolase family protein [Nordella sp. HKS 07]
MKNAIAYVLVSVLLSILTLAVFEGGYSIAEWRKPHRSILYQLSTLAGLAPPFNNASAYQPYFADPRELAELVPLIKAENVGIGGTPYDVRSTDSAVGQLENGCPGLKPNLRMTAIILRSSAFGPLGFPTAFFQVDKKLDPQLKDFFQRYGGPPTTLTTNAQGERTTVPEVTADRVVLVAGDSVAFGAMIDDDATIASQLQARDQARHYVNLGVPGATAAQIHCRLEAATARYKGRIDELIYVYCENDFDEKIPYGTPGEVVNSLKEIVAREKIGKVTVMFAPTVNMVMPEMTRIDGSEWSPTARREKQRAELESLVKAAGFRWGDIGTLAQGEADARKSKLAIWSYYVDMVHWSAYGTSKVVDFLTRRTPNS